MHRKKTPHAHKCTCTTLVLPAEGGTHPRLPALDVRLHREVLCLSWEFKMVSCLCFRSSRTALKSSSSHRSQNDRKDQLQFLYTAVIFSSQAYSVAFFATQKEARFKHTNRGLFQEGLCIQTGSVRHQQLCHMYLKPQRQQQNDKNVLRTLICFLLPVSIAVPDPSRPQRGAPAIRPNLSGPCELRPPAAAPWPERSRWLPQCGAERIKTKIARIY